MSNIIDSIKVSGVTYSIQGSGGSPTVELTQAEYDALVTAGTVASNTYYIITDAQAGDLTQYWTSAQTSSAINQAVSGKQDTLVSGTNIKTINNESLLGSGNIDIQGGGKAIEAGRGIAITTGATADTVSFNLPISAGTGSNSLIISEGSTASGAKSIAGGQGGLASKEGAVSIGQNTQATERWAFAFGNQTHSYGKYSMAINNSNTVTGESSFSCGSNNLCYNYSEFGCGYFNNSTGGTLFSVGNGTSSNARHNAFEIRQNGDIYCSDGTNDVKLQDYLQIKAVKVTQAQYDALVQGGTVDANTLYIITNVVS